MTPEQRADALVTEWGDDVSGDHPNVLGSDLADPDTDRMARDIAAQIRAAVLEERAACARMLEEAAIGTSFLTDLLLRTLAVEMLSRKP